MKRIFALEKEFAHDYISKIENATSEDRKAAIDWYGEQIPESILLTDGNIANIEITGPLSKKGPSPLARFFGYGGTAYEEIINSIEIAEKDESIKKIQLQMDTPGGDVLGVDEVYQAVAKCKKNIVAINNGMIASAGYWIASACKKIYAIESVNLTGSIGVVIIGVDYSKMYEEIGIKVVEIVSRNAPNKRPDIKTKKGRDVLQAEADSIENVFIDRVSQGRKKDKEFVIDNFGNGGLLIAENPDGTDAKKAGMIDGFFKKVEILESENKERDFDMNISANAENINSIPEGDKTEETMSLSLKEFLAENPDAKAKYEKDIVDAKTQGVENGKAEMQKRIDATVKYIGNENYPGIETIAKEVLSGESDVSAIKAAVAAFDMMTENKKSVEAKTETEETGETPAEIHGEKKQDGTVKSEDDFKAVVAESKGVK